MRPAPSPKIAGRKVGLIVNVILMTLFLGLILIANLPKGRKPSEISLLHRLAVRFELYAEANGRPPGTWDELGTVLDPQAMNKMQEDFNLPTPVQNNFYFVTNGIVLVPYTYNMRILLIRSAPVRYHGDAVRLAIVCNNRGGSNSWDFRARVLPNDQAEQAFHDAHVELKSLK